ncbi:MAG: hypothetical protein II891_06835 [Bacteroidales bacterium]|nr:hypothetical protein [Bacteroidales bacterium]
MNDVALWLRGGAEVREGLRLLGIYTPNPLLERLVTARPRLYKSQLVKALSGYSDVPAGQLLAPPEPQPRNRFREEWPFLSKPGCPVELKILANDKITAYEGTIEGHRALFECGSLEDCFETAKKLLKNFQQNRQITAEFAYYKEHGKILGKHPVFAQSRQYDAYRKMSVVELVAESKRLKGAIWRAESEIRRGDKPHLKDSREERIEAKRRQLEVVEGMIAESDKRTR